MYHASIPVFMHMLGNLSNIMRNAKIHAETHKIDPTVFINFRLAPNIYPLSRQVQIATDVLKGAAANLSGVDIHSFEDNLSTFVKLQARIAKTIAFLKSKSLLARKK